MVLLCQWLVETLNQQMSSQHQPQHQLKTWMTCWKSSSTSHQLCYSWKEMLRTLSVVIRINSNTNVFSLLTVHWISLNTKFQCNYFVLTGFSRQAIAILNQHKVDYGTFDIFANEKVRQGLKTYSNWPTYPQVQQKNLIYYVTSWQ